MKKTPEHPVLLIQSSENCFVPPAWNKKYAPLGLCYLAAALRKAHIPVAILDLDVENHLSTQFESIVRNLNPPIIGVQFNTVTRFAGFDIIKKCRKILPASIIIVGGPHSSQKSVETLSHLTEIDIAVNGEGEKIFPDLCYSLLNGNDWREIQSITYRSNGKIISNPRKDFIEDLDSIPEPAIDLLQYESYFNPVDVGYNQGFKRFTTLITSRGCPFNCSFCVTPINWGRNTRNRSVESILDEIERLITSYKIEAIQFLDDTFNLKSRHLIELCETLIARDVHISWSCYLRVDNVSQEMLRLMKAAGCYAVLYGGESAIPRHLDNTIGKGIDVGQILTLDRYCAEIGIISHGLFIISLPDETFNEAWETIKLANKLKGMSSINALWILPGTRIEKIAFEKNILPKDFSWNDKTYRQNYFPGIARNVPVFFDRLSKKEIGFLMYEWAKNQADFSLYSRFKEAVKSIKSASDLKAFWLAGVGILSSAFHKKPN